MTRLTSALPTRESGHHLTPTRVQRGCDMKKRFSLLAIVMALLSSVVIAQNNKWNSAGLPQAPPGRAGGPAPASPPAPKRDLTGIWDAGGGGIGARGMPTAPLTPWGDALGKTHHSGDG